MKAKVLTYYPLFLFYLNLARRNIEMRQNQQPQEVICKVFTDIFIMIAWLPEWLDLTVSLLPISFYYKDPDRNIVEVFVDLGNWDTHDFHKNSMGTFVDADKLVAARYVACRAPAACLCRWVSAF